MHTVCLEVLAGSPATVANETFFSDERPELPRKHWLAVFYWSSRACLFRLKLKIPRVLAAIPGHHHRPVCLAEFSTDGHGRVYSVLGLEIPRVLAGIFRRSFPVSFPLNLRIPRELAGIPRHHHRPISLAEFSPDLFRLKVKIPRVLARIPDHHHTPVWLAKVPGRRRWRSVDCWSSQTSWLVCSAWSIKLTTMRSTGRWPS